MKKAIIITAIVWSFFVSLSWWLNSTAAEESRQKLALETSRSFVQQMIFARRWNAQLGGVYAPLSADLQPNPYLEDPLREIRTDQGIVLTKINPAMMTRQISELSGLEDGVKLHITSLNPINPANVATDWERQWLFSFSSGVREQGAFNDDLSYRYMAPLFVEQSCLECHAKQGYQIGDVRGGISVTLPVGNTPASAADYGHAMAMAGGLFFIVYGGVLLQRKQHKQEELIMLLTSASAQINTLKAIVPICMHCKGIRDDQGYWTKVETYISEHSGTEFSHGICPYCMEKFHPAPTSS